MEEIKKEIEVMAKRLDDLVVKIVTKANDFRQYPHYETGDKFDRCAIYVSAARAKLANARSELC